AYRCRTERERTNLREGELAGKKPHAAVRSEVEPLRRDDVKCAECLRSHLFGRFDRLGAEIQDAEEDLLVAAVAQHLRLVSGLGVLEADRIARRGGDRL